MLRHDETKEEGKNSFQGHYLSHHHYVVGIVVQLFRISVFDARFQEEERFFAVVTPEVVFVGDQITDLFL